MVKKLALYLIGCAFFIIVQVSAVSSQDFNEIDAVSSASEEIKVLSGKAYSTTAELNTYHKFEHAKHRFHWGKTNTFDQEQRIPDSPTEQTFTLEGLDPDTKYFFIYSGTDSNRQLEYKVEGEFQTVGQTGLINSQHLFNAKKPFGYVKNNTLYINSPLESSAMISIIDLKGKMVNNFTFDKSLSKINLDHISQKVYILNISFLENNLEDNFLVNSIK